jgi:lipoyl(octanoyl) transferase
MQDIKAYIAALQNVVIGALEELGVQSFAKPGDELGVWVATPAGEAKIAAFGVRVRRWVAFHGLALNVNPNMEHFARILPCGLHKPVTSLHALGLKCPMDEVDEALQRSWARQFGPL